MEELSKEQNPIAKEKALKIIGWAAVVGIVVWGAVAVAAAIMLVGFGAWGWVVWPLAFYFWAQHVGRAVQVYVNAKKPKPRWEQHVTVNVTSELTAEQISEAATKALDEKLKYGLRD